MAWIATLLMLAGSTAQVPATVPGDTFGVGDVIDGQNILVGRRLIIRGLLADCHRLSCGLRGTDGNGRQRYISIGPDGAFDSSVSSFEGREIEIEATVTDHCMPSENPDIIVMCTDRPATLVRPVSFESAERRIDALPSPH